MIAHLWKMVWNRRRQNLWMIAEITASMLVLLAIGVAALGAWQRYERPIGFDPHDLWLIHAVAQVEGPADDSIRRQADELQTFLREHPKVSELGVGIFRPYSGEAMTTSFTTDSGRFLMIHQFFTDPDFFAAADLELKAGRWLEAQDQGVGDRPVVITEGLARITFGERDPVGQTFSQSDDGPTYRVVGVIGDFRWGGELSNDKHTIFQSMSLDRPREFPFRAFVMEMHPEAGVDTEQELLAGLQARGPDWSFDLDRVSDLREQHLRNGLTPLVAAAVVAGFLILMVGLGLTGVLWQNITRRSREIGLRRAQGASAGAIHRQIVGEIWVLTTLGIVPALVIAVQLPLFDLIGSDELPVLGMSFVLAAALLYGLTTTCALYPCRMVTGQTPGEALHHD